MFANDYMQAIASISISNVEWASQLASTFLIWAKIWWKSCKHVQAVPFLNKKGKIEDLMPLCKCRAYSEKEVRPGDKFTNSMLVLMSRI